MKRIIILCTLFLVSFNSFCQIAFIIDKPTPLRRNSDIRSGIILTLNPKDTVFIYGDNDFCYKVVFKVYDGFVPSTYLDIPPNDFLKISRDDQNEINSRHIFELKGKSYLDSLVKVDQAELKGLELIRQKAYNKHVKEIYLKFGKKYGKLILDGDIRIGMTEDMIEAIKGGSPTKINTSHYSFGVYSQWVYQNKELPSFTEYYYFKNGRLTSYQD